MDYYYCLVIRMIAWLNFLLFSQEVTFKVDYAVPSIGREFGSVFLGDKNVALLVVAEGWAKVKLFLFWHVTLIWFWTNFCAGAYWICHMQVREQGQQKGEASPFLADLLRLEEQAKQEGLGRWSKVSAPTLPPIKNFSFWFMVFVFWLISSTEQMSLP